MKAKPKRRQIVLPFTLFNFLLSLMMSGSTLLTDEAPLPYLLFSLWVLIVSGSTEYFIDKKYAYRQNFDDIRALYITIQTMLNVLFLIIFHVIL